MERISGQVPAKYQPECQISGAYPAKTNFEIYIRLDTGYKKGRVFGLSLDEIVQTCISEEDPKREENRRKEEEKAQG